MSIDISSIGMQAQQIASLRLQSQINATNVSVDSQMSIIQTGLQSADSSSVDSVALNGRGIKVDMVV